MTQLRSKQQNYLASSDLSAEAFKNQILRRRRMKKILILTLSFLFIQTAAVYAQDAYGIFDDRKMLEGFAEKFKDRNMDTLLTMIRDENLSSFRSAAAIRVLREKYAGSLVSSDKKTVEKTLLRRLKRTNSPFVQVEIMRALTQIDRYEYFKSMVPALIQKLDHYNDALNALAFETLNEVVDSGQDRPREARIIFNTLRKVLFLSRRRLEDIIDPDSRLAQKLQLLRWSIKVLGNQELKRLPKEVINLL